MRCWHSRTFTSGPQLPSVQKFPKDSPASYKQAGWPQAVGKDSEAEPQQSKARRKDGAGSAEIRPVSDTRPDHVGAIRWWTKDATIARLGSSPQKAWRDAGRTLGKVGNREAVTGQPSAQLAKLVKDLHKSGQGAQPAKAAVSKPSGKGATPAQGKDAPAAAERPGGGSEGSGIATQAPRLLARIERLFMKHQPHGATWLGQALSGWEKGIVDAWPCREPPAAAGGTGSDRSQDQGASAPAAGPQPVITAGVHRVVGRITKWVGGYGWLQLLAEPGREPPGILGGRTKVYVHRGDLPPASPVPQQGTVFSFRPAKDDRGRLHAAECRRHPTADHAGAQGAGADTPRAREGAKGPERGSAAAMSRMVTDIQANLVKSQQDADRTMRECQQRIRE
eukprot:gene5537-179_t